MIHRWTPLRPSGMCAAARGSKTVTWRGLGDLPQFTWAIPPAASWLVIDLWAGFSGLCVALLAMGARFHAVAAETDPFPAQVASQLMPHIVTIDAVENVTGAMFRPFLQRRQVRRIILGGGSPCQGNSALNPGRKGLGDVRSQQPQELVRIRAELLAYRISACGSRPFLRKCRFHASGRSNTVHAMDGV